MGKVRNSQSGFSAVEVLLALIFVAIVAFIGVYVAHNRNNSKPATSTTNSNKTNSTSKPPTSNNKTAAKAASRATDIATRLLLATTGTQTTQGVPKTTYVDGHVTDGDFTPSFKAAVDNGTALPNGDGSPVACTNGIFPDSFGAGTTTLSGDSATVQLTLLKGGSDITKYYSYMPQVTLKYVNSNWSVDNYACVSNPNVTTQ